MQKLQHYFMATACFALLGAASFASSAEAAVTCNGSGPNCSLGTQAYVFGADDVYGGGSSLVAPYWRQTNDCYGNPADLVTKGTPPTFVDENLFDYTTTGGTGVQNCATQHIINTATIWYISTGSGSGILGVFSHDPQSFWGEVNTNGPQFFSEVFYGLSDAGLGSSDVTAYNSGGVYHQSTTTITISAPGGESCSAVGEPYPNPAQCYGPLIQFPFSIDPVAVFYPNKGIYEKIYNPGAKAPKEVDYSFNVYQGGGNGGLRLSAKSLCGIYNGQITNWNDPSLTADNNATSLKSLSDPTTVANWELATGGAPLFPVARSDSSGTTSIMTRHLAAVCNGFGYANLYTTGATTIQNAGASSIVGNTYNVNNPNWPGVDETGKITLAPNSAGVAQYVAFTETAKAANVDTCPTSDALPSGYTVCIQQGRVGYVGPDYVLPFVKSTGTNNFQLYAAKLQNKSLNWENPTPAGASIAFGSVLPPQTNTNGSYNATLTTNGLRNDPTAWVEGLNPAVALANPTPKTAYPLVGTTNMMAYTCYANAANLATFSGAVNYVEEYNINFNAAKSILAQAGLSPLPTAWRDAIDQTFLTNSDKLNLEFQTGGTAPTCTGINGA